jgi:hypothetical protein
VSCVSKVTSFSGLSILDCHLHLVSCVTKVTSFSGLSILDCHLRLVYPRLQVSLDCPFLIATSVSLTFIIILIIVLFVTI